MSENEESNNERVHYGRLIIHSSHAIKMRLDSQLEKFHITGQQSRIIHYLCGKKDEEVMQRTMEEDFSLKSSSITVILNTLEKKGFIQRIPSSKDGRVKFIKITPMGEELHKVSGENIEAIEQQIVKGMSQQQQEELHKLLTIALKNIEE